MNEEFFSPSVEITCRENFGSLLDKLGLTGRAIEIGTHCADFADALLRSWSGRILYCVDPWQQDMPGYNDKINKRDRNEDRGEAMKKLRAHGSRYRVMRMTSAQAAKRFPNECMDFVYLDGDHEKIVEDIAAWWPKVKPEGILAGHDLNSEWGEYVEPAVISLCDMNGIQAQYVLGDAASFYLTKPLDGPGRGA